MRIIFLLTFIFSLPTFSQEEQNDQLLDYLNKDLGKDSAEYFKILSVESLKGSVELAPNFNKSREHFAETREVC